MEYTQKIQLPLAISLIVLIILFLIGCSSQSAGAERDITKVDLSSTEQSLADSIWECRNLWKGCHDLAIYKRSDQYYLAINLVVNKSNSPVSSLGSVTTCKYEVYYISNHQVGDHVTLADAAVTSTGTCLSKIYPKETDSADIQRALISQLVSKAY